MIACCCSAAAATSRVGLKIALADVNEAALDMAGKEVAAIVGESNVLVIPTDVSQFDQVVRLRDKVYDAWGEVRVLRGSTKFITVIDAEIIGCSVNEQCGSSSANQVLEEPGQLAGDIRGQSLWVSDTPAVFGYSVCIN